MGLFSKDPDKAAAREVRKAEIQARADARAQAHMEKERAKALASMDKAKAKAQKRGVNVDGTVAVGHIFDDSADQFLLVFPDRVEHVRMGKFGSMFRSGAGTETIPVSRISSTEGQNKGIWYVLEVHTSGNRIEFKADQLVGPALRQAILDLMTQPASARPTTTAEPALTDQIKKLAELHAAGILTDDEFATKKADLLERM